MGAGKPKSSPRFPILYKHFLFFNIVMSIAEIESLLDEVVMATLKELEELWDQGEAELSSIMSSDHTRTARIRWGM